RGAAVTDAHATGDGLAVGLGLVGTKMQGPWTGELRHIDGTVSTIHLESLQDLKESPVTVSFCGTAIYRCSLTVDAPDKIKWIDLGKVAGLCELAVNGKEAGLRWYARRIYPAAGLLKK